MEDSVTLNFSYQAIGAFHNKMLDLIIENTAPNTKPSLHVIISTLISVLEGNINKRQELLNTNEVDEFQNQIDNIISDIDYNRFLFSKGDMSLFGELHNSDDNIEELKNNLYEYGSQIHEINNPYFLRSVLSPELYSRAIDIKEIFTNNSSNNITAELNKYALNLQTTNISHDDLMITLAAIEVGKSSNEYWQNEFNKGDESKWQQIFNYQHVVVTNSLPWWLVAIGDLLGALIYGGIYLAIYRGKNFNLTMFGVYCAIGAAMFSGVAYSIPDSDF